METERNGQAQTNIVRQLEDCTLSQDLVEQLNKKNIIFTYRMEIIKMFQLNINIKNLQCLQYFEKQ